MAAADHSAHVTSLFRQPASTATTVAGNAVRRTMYRQKTLDLLLNMHCQFLDLGLGGLQKLQVDEQELEDGIYPEKWNTGSVVIDKGPDGMCARNFSLKSLRLNLDWIFDTRHGGHHSAMHAIDYAKLRVNNWLMLYAYNIGLGEWKDGARRDQIVESIQDTVTVCVCSEDDAVWQLTYPGMVRDNKFSRTPATALDEQGDYEHVKNDHVWLQSDTRCSNSKFFGSIQRFKYRESEAWGGRL